MTTFSSSSLVAALALALWAPLAEAQDTDTESESAPASAADEYDRAIDSALAEYRMQNYIEARSFFEHAHAVQPSARTLRGLGMVEFELKHYVSAAVHLQASLDDPRRPLPEDQRAEVTELLARTKLFLGQYTLRVEPRETEVRAEVDSTPLTLDPSGRFLLEAGEHTLMLTTAHGQSLTRRLDVRGGDDRTLTFDFSRPDDQGAQGATPLAMADDVQMLPPARMRAAKGLLLVGGVAGLTGVGLGAVAFHGAKGQTQGSPEGDRSVAMARGADACVGLAAAAVVTGLVLWITSRRGAAANASSARFDGLSLTGTRF